MFFFFFTISFDLLKYFPGSVVLQFTTPTLESDIAKEKKMPRQLFNN